VMVEAAFRELKSRRHIVHGCGVISLLLKEARGSAQDFLARFDRSFAKHHQRWYRGMALLLY